MNYDSEEPEQVIECKSEVGLEDKRDKRKALASNKLVIKLKADPMAAHDVVVSADDDDGFLKSKTPSCCKQCGKEFSSGKAVGAHMRVHNHPHPHPLSAANLRSSSGGMGGGGGKSYLLDLLKDGKPTCSICSKSFLSLKSLFGHMRCHPERRWRGMHPPNHPNSSSKELPAAAATTTSPCSGPHHGSWTYSPPSGPIMSVSDLVQCLPGWSVKGKRGRKSSIVMAPVNDNDNDNDDEMLYSAVHGLMMLQAESKKHLHHQHDGCVGAEIGNGDDLKGSRNCDFDLDETNVYESDYKKRKVIRKIINIKDLEYSSNIDNVDYKTIPSVRCYKCATCDKSFASPQALGGHRSSAHNKILNKNTTVVFEKNCGGRGLEEFDEDTNTTRAVLHPPFPPQPAAPSHVCKICEKAFPSGQALGGHQRCHWQAPISSSSSSSPAGQQLMSMLCDDQSESPAAAASGTKEAAALDFDLNEVPVDDHGEEGSKCNGAVNGV